MNPYQDAGIQAANQGSAPLLTIIAITVMAIGLVTMLHHTGVLTSLLDSIIGHRDDDSELDEAQGGSQDNEAQGVSGESFVVQPWPGFDPEAIFGPLEDESSVNQPQPN